jgi:hypothetical protein
MSRVRKLLILASFLLLAHPLSAAITFVSASSTACINSEAATSSLTCTLTASTSGSHTVLVMIAIRTNTSTVSSVTDSGGSSYSQCSGCALNNNAREEIWTTAVNSSIASTTVTVNLSAGSKFVMSVEEYSGAAALGKTATASLSSANPSISLTTQDNNNFVTVGFAGQGVSTFTASTGNLRANSVTSGGSSSANVGGAACDNTAASPSSVTCTVTNADVNWACVALELRTVAPTQGCGELALVGAGC